jgi:hypothetical protein
MGLFGTLGCGIEAVAATADDDFWSWRSTVLPART